MGEDQPQLGQDPKWKLMDYQVQFILRVFAISLLNCICRSMGSIGFAITGGTLNIVFWRTRWVLCVHLPGVYLPSL